MVWEPDGGDYECLCFSAGLSLGGAAAVPC